jgi:hypothetical protein
MTRHALVAAALVAVLAPAGVLSACGGGTNLGNGPEIGKKGKDEKASVALGFPGFATKNTTRVGGADPTADAAGVALAVFSGRAQRPNAVTVVDADSWQAGLAAAVFMSPPVRAPILFSEDGDLPDASADALDALDPIGARTVDGAKVIRVGDDAAKVEDRKAIEVKGDNPYALAREIDRVHAAAVGKSSDRVIVTSGERPQFAMPAAAWAAKGGDPILYVKRDSIPAETLSALRGHQQPKIYVLGPPAAVSDKVVTQLRRLGTVRRIAGPDPVSNAIAFARFVDGAFGWGIIDPGHGLVFANVNRPLDAAAGAPLSASGTYGPLLLVQGAGLPRSLVAYLLDIQPGYDRDPVRAVYNHGWLMGDADAISISDQARLDALLEIVPVNVATAKPPSS